MDKTIFLFFGILSMVTANDVLFIKLNLYNGTLSNGKPYLKQFYVSREYNFPASHLNAFCNSQNMEGAIFDTINEYYFVRQELLPLMPNLASHIYVDLATETPGSPTNWKWTKTEESVSFPIEWYPGRPNGGAEGCVGLYKGTGSILQWDDMQCDWVGSLLCQVHYKSY